MGQHLEEAKKHLASRCDVMADLIDRYIPPAINPEPPERYFDVLVSSIIGQQLSVKAADTIEARLRAAVSDFRPSILQEMDPASMKEHGLSGAKATYIQSLAQSFHDGQIDPHELAKLDNDDVHAKLTALKGVGPWTAEMFLIFGMGRPDVWSPGDLALRRTVGTFFGESADLAEVSNRWRPYRSYASLYLWRYSDEGAGAQKAVV